MSEYAILNDTPLYVNNLWYFPLPQLHKAFGPSFNKDIK